MKDTWAEILCASNTFRLLIVAKGAHNLAFREQVIGQFEARGVGRAKVTVVPTMAMEQFLQLFHSIDLALDPFPYGGGTTSLHTIWMGVPIVAIEGESELSRASAGILKVVGCE